MDAESRRPIQNQTKKRHHTHTTLVGKSLSSARHTTNTRSTTRTRTHSRLGTVAEWQDTAQFTSASFLLSSQQHFTLMFFFLFLICRLLTDLHDVLYLLPCSLSSSSSILAAAAAADTLLFSTMLSLFYPSNHGLFDFCEIISSHNPSSSIFTLLIFFNFQIPSFSILIIIVCNHT